MASRLVPGPLRRLIRFLRPRSSGIPVRRAAMRHLRAAAEASRAGDWSAAAEGYARGLAEAPHLPRIWVQYGHMLRETGRPEEAREAYRRAIELAPREREPHLFLLRLARAAGRRDQVLHHALAAFRLDPGDAQGRTMLLLAASAGEPDQDAAIAEVAAAISLSIPETAPVNPAAVYLDVGDLIAHYARSRLPSGLQRVEIEVARAAIVCGRDVALCCWSAAAAGWKPIGDKMFVALAEAAAGDGDEAAWQRTFAEALLALAVAPAVDFAAGSTLLNLGMAWGDPLYHTAVACAKAGGGLRYAAIACDVIPLVRPDQVPTDIAAACGEWLDALAGVADAVVAISRATRDDVVAVSAKRGRPIAHERVGVVPLDAVFPAGGLAPPGVLARHGLVPGGYALYVSTVEPRKNHLAAFEAWRRLAVDVAGSVPDLVCVGRLGWRSEAVLADLAAHRALAGGVHLLQGISDAELGALYGGCAFLFYPSLQEGWGLPVTEALAHGKVPAIGRNSSLPEAGGAFAVYFDATSPAAMAAALAPLVADPAARAEREAAIRRDFRPRAWAEIADAMIAVATAAIPSESSPDCAAAPASVSRPA